MKSSRTGAWYNTKPMKMKKFWILILLAAGGIGFAQWKVTTSADEITGAISCYAISKSVKPLHELDFPYTGVISWIGFGTNNKKEWAYIGFSTAPNLVGGKIGNGYTTYSLRVRWDNNPGTMQFFQKWGSKFLHPLNYTKFIANLRRHKLFLIELHWFGQEDVYFRYSIAGAKQAIDQARAKCKKK